MVNTRSSPSSKSTPNPSAGKPSPSSTSGVAAASAKIIPSSPINAAVLGHPGHEIYVGNPAQLEAVQAARLPIPKGSRRSERIRNLGFQPAKSPSTKSYVPANSSVRGKKVLSSASESLISVKNKGKAASINYGSTNSGEEEDGLECESSLNGDDSSDEDVVLGADDIDEAEAEDLEDSVEMGKSLEPEVDLLPVSKHSKKRKSPRRASTAVPNVQIKKRATKQSSACSSSRPSKGDSVVRTSAKALNEDYQREIEVASSERELTVEEENKIYLRVVGVKKQRVYGLGSVGSSLVSDGTSNRSNAQMVEDNLTEFKSEMLEKLNEVKKCREEMEKKHAQERKYWEEREKKYKEEIEKMEQHRAEVDKKLQIIMDSLGHRSSR